jgi:teichuronic acid biosynthesis glycosyltransferase TuaH
LTPIIGYVGYLASIKLDIDLLEFLARSRPDWSIVLLGPEDNVFTHCKLHGYANIHFLDAQDVNKLPEYIKAFDVALNPQLTNNLTTGNYPRKIDGYISMGKPIITTKIKAMEMFKEHVYLDSTKEEYISLTERALVENSDDLIKKIIFAKSNTWENNVSAIYNALITATKHKIKWD